MIFTISMLILIAFDLFLVFSVSRARTERDKLSDKCTQLSNALDHLTGKYNILQLEHRNFCIISAKHSKSVEVRCNVALRASEKELEDLTRRYELQTASLQHKIHLARRGKCDTNAIEGDIIVH